MATTRQKAKGSSGNSCRGQQGIHGGLGVEALPGKPDCPDGLSRAGRCRLVTEVEGKNSPVWAAAGPRGTGFPVSRAEKAVPIDRQSLRLLRPPPSSRGWGEGVSFPNNEDPPQPVHIPSAGKSRGPVLR